MAHLSARDGYRRFVERLNRFPLGAPPAESLDRILELLLSPREAELLSKVPIRPFRPETAARAWDLPLAEARKVLDGLASRAVLLDLEQDGKPLYVLPPPMAGFLEFSMMRVRGDLDQHRLAELLYEYINVEDDFVRNLFAGGSTPLVRAFVQEQALPPELSLTVLDWERASHVVREASAVAVGVCYCRHKMEHVHRACDAPREICLTMNDTARSLARHGFARPIEPSEALDLLAEAQGRSLVQLGENIRERPSFVCNCCGCCCEALLAARRTGFTRAVETTGFVAELDPATCTACGRCGEVCPVGALATAEAPAVAEVPAVAEAPGPGRRRLAVALDPGRCLGCGVCVRACARGSLRLVPRANRVLSPVDTVERVVLMAIERGKLQELVFDNQAHLAHRVMAAILGAILRLPPVKQALASEQLRSRYLRALIRRASPTA